MKKYFLLFSVLLCSLLILAHEFWLQPDKFIYKRGETINLRFMVGENFEGENWSGNRDRVQSLNFYFGGVKDSCRQGLSDKKGDSLQIALYDEGTAMLSFNSTNSFIELDAEKFNNYLKEDGLTEAIEYRKQHNENKKKGRENYQRCAKTILQVGNKTDKTFKQHTNLLIDIIPYDNPYNVAKDENFKVRIFFNKQPLAHTLVKVWHRQNNKTTQTTHTTDKGGEVKFFLTPSGQWMVSTVKMARLENDPKADWQSYWGSLTWGYEK